MTVGFRFRKSINLGGGFRVNLSKSGVGYSWGGKGYRITKTAKGKIRTTVSIPGTGLSYSEEFGSKNKGRAGGQSGTPGKPQYVPAIDNNHYDTQEIKNADVKNLVSEGLEEMLTSANQSLKFYRWNLVAFWVSLILGCSTPAFWILSAACVVVAIYLRRNGVIDLEYTFEDDQAAAVAERINPLIRIANCKKVWYISQTSKVIDRKYAAGASSTIKRNNCKASTKVPFPFKTNTTAVSFKLGKETIVFLPDKLFVFQKGKIGALSYSDVTTSVHCQRFIESELIPGDTQIVDYTWQYVNKSGGPDKRFKNNKKLPICLYGEMEVRSALGLNTNIMFSNPNIR